MPCRDLYGYALTTGQAAAAAYNPGVRDLLRLRTGAVGRRGRRSRTTRPSRSATPRSRCSATSCAPPSTSGPGCATPSLHAARGTERERSHVHAVAAHVRGDSRPLVAHLAAYPATRCCCRSRCPTIAFAGVTEVPEEAWSIVERAIPAYGDDWWFTGLLAFVRQEQGRFDEAMELSCRSLARGAGGRALGARPGPRALRDRRPRGRAGLDGRLGRR